MQMMLWADARIYLTIQAWGEASSELECQLLNDDVKFLH